MSNLIFGNALSGLRTNSVQLATTSNNVANVNKEGYTRQTAETRFGRSQLTNVGFQGTGVEVSTISRNVSDFLLKQVNKATSDFAFVNEKLNTLSRVDTLFSDDNAGISSALQDFFDAAQDLSGNPSDIPIRQSFLASANSLARRFNSLDSSLTDIMDQNSRAINESVAQVNSLAGQLAKLNSDITKSAAAASEKAPDNALLDQRDLLIMQISEQVAVNTLEQNDGTYTVLLANGQTLVTGDRAYQMQTRIDPTNQEALEVGFLVPDSTGQDSFLKLKTDSTDSGRLFSLVETRKEQLEPYQAQLGLVAIRLSEEVNAIFESGFDLSGNPGQALFSFGGSPVSSVFADLRNSNPNATLEVLQFDSELVANSDYEIRVIGGSATLIPGGVSAPIDAVTGEVDFPGVGLLRFDAPTDGDRFFVKFSRNASANIQVDITDPSTLGLAAQPGFVGDNTQALKIIDLQTKKVMSLSGKGESLLDNYRSLVSRVGTDTREVTVATEAKAETLSQAVFDIEAVSGVNLDEEAANLLKFQQAYQANGQVLAVAQQLFAELLAALRG